MGSYSAYKYLRCRCQVEEARVFSSAQQHGKGDGDKLEHGTFHLDVKKNCFILRVIEHWNCLERL